MFRFGRSLVCRTDHDIISLDILIMIVVKSMSNNYRIFITFVYISISAFFLTDFALLGLSPGKITKIFE